VDEQLAGGKDVILEIEIQGALKVKAKRPDTVLIFVTPPNALELERRLTGRGTETAEVIAQRMARAVEESGSMALYDYILVNDDLEVCTDELHALIQSQHSQSSHQKEFITTICRQLKEREENKK
jgi:guanylate kinase